MFNNLLKMEMDYFYILLRSSTSIIKRNKNDTFIFILLIIGLISYKKSLIRCEDHIGICARKFGIEQCTKIFIQIMIAGLSLFLYFLWIIYKKVNLLHFIYIILPYTYLIITEKGDDFGKHGTINLLVLGITLFAYLLFFLIFNTMLRFLKKFNMILFFGFSLILIIYSYKFYNQFFSTYRCEFYQGINGDIAYFDPEYDKCKMVEFDQCDIENYGDLFDLIKKLNYKCRHEKLEYEEFIKNMPERLKKSKKYAFPSSKILPIPDIEDVYTEPRLMQSGGAIIDLEKQPDYPHEIEINWDENNKGHLKINVTRNETLIKEREVIRKEKKVKYFTKNTLVFYFDAVSRRNFIRQMPKSADIILKFLYKKNELQSDKKCESFEFLKMNAIYDNTYPNNLALYYGTDFVANNGTSIIKYYKENGYITGLTGDGCMKESFDYYNGKRIKNVSIDFQEYDHDGGVMFCGGNFFDLDAPHIKPTAIYGPLRHCLYGLDTYEYVFEYSTQFWEVYKDQPKYYKIAFNYGHEISMNVLKYLDEPFANFFQNWISNGYLDDTTLFIVSDHGNQVSVFYEFISKEHYQERTLPMFYIMIPNKNRNIKEEESKQIKENLLFNRDRFTVPFDSYVTMLYLVFYSDNYSFDKYSSNAGGGMNLFRKITKKRNCDSFPYFSHLGNEHCRCFS